MVHDFFLLSLPSESKCESDSVQCLCYNIKVICHMEFYVMSIVVSGSYHYYAAQLTAASNMYIKD